MTEVLLVDSQDNPLGTMDKLAAHRTGDLHRAFSIFILRKIGSHYETLLQQRALGKYHSGGLWTNACCSHPLPQEDILLAGERRLQEEVGIVLPLKAIGAFEYRAELTNGLIEHEFDHVLVGMIDSLEHFSMSPNPEEVAACRWVGLEELQADIVKSPQIYTAWLAPALQIVKTHFEIT